MDLEALFAETETREVQRDFTIRFRNVYWQIPEREAAHVSPGSSVVVELRLNGETRIRAGDRYLEAECLGRARPKPRPAPSPEKPSGAKPAPRKPKSNHPWRRDFENDARLALAKRKARERDAKGGTDR